jgi:hypothetical protein
MTEEKKQIHEVKSRGKVFNFVMYVVPCIIFFYVLSIGPVFWLYKMNSWELSSFWIIYFPLSWLHDNTFFEKPLDWYIGLYDL